MGNGIPVAAGAARGGKGGLRFDARRGPRATGSGPRRDHACVADAVATARQPGV